MIISLVAPCLVLAFFVGAIPTALLFGRRMGVDLRTTGSGNLGATNVYRTLGARAGVIVLAIDMLKGALAVFATRAATGSGSWPVVAGALALAGHILSPFAGFRGGKGVATGGGVILALAPLAGLVAIVIFVATVAITRYVSLGSILAAASLPPLVWATGSDVPGLIWASIAIALLVIARHRTNIARILAGNERRFTARAAAPDEAARGTNAGAPGEGR